MSAITLLAILGLLAQGSPSDTAGSLVYLPLDELHPGTKGPRLGADSDRGKVQWSPELSVGGRLVVEGGVVLVEGVVRGALKFDGFTGLATLDGVPTPTSLTEFTAEAWVALNSYPPGWCTIAGRWQDLAGWELAVGPLGRLRFDLVTNLGRFTCWAREGAVPHRQWAHVAGVLGTDSFLRIYVDGRQVAWKKVDGAPKQAFGAPLRLGGAAQSWWIFSDTPKDSVRPEVEPHFGVDGILDEVRVLTHARSKEEVVELVTTHKPQPPSALSPRHMPTGPPGPAAFGAIQCNLPYSEEWDALRNDGPLPDVVVRLDTSGARVLFWGGLMHAPIWVTPEGIRARGTDPHDWISIRAGDGWTSPRHAQVGLEGILRHPRRSDTSARVLESHAARAVVHRRYALRSPDRTADRMWADETVTLYPDACGTRTVFLEEWVGMWPPEVDIRALLDPGQVPRDVVHQNFKTFIDTDGTTVALQFGGDHWFEYARGQQPGGLVVTRLNLRSDTRPFQAIAVDTRSGPGGYEPPLREYDSPSRLVLKLPWGGSFWRAWDIDGTTRPSIAPGGAEWSVFPSDQSSGVRLVVLCGIRDDSMEELQALARSWYAAPELTVTGGSWHCVGWDRSQRAWRIGRLSSATDDQISMRIDASEESPIVRPALLLHGWGERKVALRINGEPASSGVGFRQGFERKLEETDLVLWLDLESTTPVLLEVEPVE